MEADPHRIDDAEPTAVEMNNLIMRLMRGVNGQVFRLFGNRVHSGPFANMIIPERNPSWDDGNSSAKLFGTYEIELHPVIEHAAWRRPGTIINVGCAEGYYAIGLATAMPKVIVHAFDTEQGSLDLCREYAEKNGVATRVHARLGCETPQQMQLHGVGGHRLYVIDVEGAEHRLVDLEKCPALVRSDIIVECHDFLQPELSAELADRLAATHQVEVVTHRLPDLQPFQFLRKVTPVMSVLAVTEKRPMPSCWLACWANTKGR